MAEALAKGARITGAQRDTLAAQLAERYVAGDSIRSIAEDTGRSFGFVHGLIKESGVDLRGRGGATRGARARRTTGDPAATTGPGDDGATVKATKTVRPAKASVLTTSLAEGVAGKAAAKKDKKNGAKKGSAKRDSTKKDSARKSPEKKSPDKKSKKR